MPEACGIWRRGTHRFLRRAFCLQLLQLRRLHRHYMSDPISQTWMTRILTYWYCAWLRKEVVWRNVV